MSVKKYCAGKNKREQQLFWYFLKKFQFDLRFVKKPQ